MGNTPQRVFRIPSDIYDAAQARAKAEGTTVTAVVVAALRRYAKGGDAARRRQGVTEEPQP